MGTPRRLTEGRLSPKAHGCGVRARAAQESTLVTSTRTQTITVRQMNEMALDIWKLEPGARGLPFDDSDENIAFASLLEAKALPEVQAAISAIVVRRYGRELIRCVELSSTRSESQARRSGVRREWGLPPTCRSD